MVPAMKKRFPECIQGSLGKVQGAHLLGLLLLLLCFAQALAPLSSDALTSRNAEDRQRNGGTQALREWKDPCLGDRWILIADPLHPNWPRKLVRRAPAKAPSILAILPSNPPSANHLQQSSVSQAADVSRRSTTPSTLAGMGFGSDVDVPVIRAGDRVTVEQRSGVVEANFQALALQSAAVGEPLRVRLANAASGTRGKRETDSQAIGGWGVVIRVIAVAGGKTSWQGGSDAVQSLGFAQGGFQP